MRHSLRSAFVSACLLVTAGLAGAPMPAAQQSPLRAMREDAELVDVFFVDSDLGWAVGDRGTIWHTEDGGRNWQLQVSPVPCRLQSVFFLDRQRGWIVGGWTKPYTHQSAGVVLRTQDGGIHWTKVGDSTLPVLRRVKFLDTRRGYAVGDRTAMYPSGFFTTTDGGRNWMMAPSQIQAHWLDAAITSAGEGVLVGGAGSCARLRLDKMVAANTPAENLRALQSVALDEQTGWAVGDGGLALTTKDQGNTWNAPPAPLPLDRKEINLRDVAMANGHVWMVGAPGSCVLHSADGGQSWDIQPTDQTVPLRSVYFRDAQRGWAVGSLGTILATRDGGRSWRVQRRGAQRVAMLAVLGEFHRLPLAMFSQYAGNDGYLAAAEIVVRTDVTSAAEFHPHVLQRAHQAAVTAGASQVDGCWQFPTRDSQLQLPALQTTAVWERINDGRGEQQLIEQMILRIRQWRPDVIITEPVSPHGTNPLSHLTNQMLLNAVAGAAKPEVHPHHLQKLKLKPWTAKKVYCLHELGGQSDVTIKTSRLATNLGMSVHDHANAASGLVSKQPTRVPAVVGLNLLVNNVPQEAGRHRVFGGLVLPSGQARRKRVHPPGGNLESLNRSAQKRRNVEQMLAMSDRLASGPAWMAQLDDLTAGLGHQAAGQILYQLSQRYDENGEWHLAAETFTRFVRRHPNHPLADSALTWLVRYYSSGETAWQRERTSGLPVVQASGVTGQTGGVRQANFADEGDTLAAAPMRRQQVTMARLTKAMEIGNQIQRTRPALAAEPSVRFPLAAAQRISQRSVGAQSLYDALTRTSLHTPWHSRAKAEAWLLKGRGLPPVPTYRCQRVETKPLLDGVLDDSMWEECKPLNLKSTYHDDGNWPAVVLLAYDAEYLYIAVDCRRAAGAEYPDGNYPRARDPILVDRDRIDLFLDMDRDYASFYWLTVDHRGWARDVCAGNTKWNPTWHVAAGGDQQSWTAECAIPWRELAPRSPNKGDTWAMGVQRTVPRVGFQSFTQPASPEPQPRGFGLLIFDPAPSP